MNKVLSGQKNEDPLSLASVLQHYGLLRDMTRENEFLIGKCPFSHLEGIRIRVNLQTNEWECLDGVSLKGGVVDFIIVKERVSRDQALSCLERWHSEANVPSDPKDAMSQKFEAESASLVRVKLFMKLLALEKL